MRTWQSFSPCRSLSTRVPFWGAQNVSIERQDCRDSNTFAHPLAFDAIISGSFLDSNLDKHPSISGCFCACKGSQLGKDLTARVARVPHRIRQICAQGHDQHVKGGLLVVANFPPLIHDSSTRRMMIFLRTFTSASFSEFTPPIGHAGWRTRKRKFGTTGLTRAYHEFLHDHQNQTKSGIILQPPAFWP